MPLFNESYVRSKAKQVVQESYALENAEDMIFDSIEKFSKYDTYDIFLSHSVRDAELILGMKVIFEELGYSIYVDWIEDKYLDRKKVNSKTANKLRERMKTSKSLFYVTTENSTTSRWMPWECGYYDGLREKVAIVPISEELQENKYEGQEYLGLYPYVIKERSNTGAETLWIHKDEQTYISYDNWVMSKNSEIEWKYE